MGIPIEVPIASVRSIFPRSAPPDRIAAGRSAFLGRIRYSDVDCDPSASAEEKDRYDGHFIYVKPAFYDTGEPLDVVHYARTHTAFPHETTADQFFSESQFESYRALGLHAAQCMTGSFPEGGSLADFAGSVATYVAGRPAEAALALEQRADIAAK